MGTLATFLTIPRRCRCHRREGKEKKKKAFYKRDRIFKNSLSFSFSSLLLCLSSLSFLSLSVYLSLSPLSFPLFLSPPLSPLSPLSLSSLLYISSLSLYSLYPFCGQFILFSVHIISWPGLWRGKNFLAMPGFFRYIWNTCWTRTRIKTYCRMLNFHYDFLLTLSSN